MGAVTTKTFGEKLQAELDAREWGVRTLARRMAEQAGQPHRVESLRRQLRKYLAADDPVSPTTLSRHVVEDALGIERDTLKDDQEVAPSGGRFRGRVGDGAARGADGASADEEAARVAGAGTPDVTGEAA